MQKHDQLLAATHPLHTGAGKVAAFALATPDPGGSYAKHLPLVVSHAVPFEVPLAGVMHDMHAKS